MKKAFLLTLALLTFVATNCLADTLVITYRSGRVQTVTLDEPMGNISSTEYRTSSPSATGSVPPLQPAPPAQEPKAENKQNPPAKSGVKFKWAPPKSISE